MNQSTLICIFQFMAPRDGVTKLAIDGAENNSITGARDAIGCPNFYSDATRVCTTLYAYFLPTGTIQLIIGVQILRSEHLLVSIVMCVWIDYNQALRHLNCMIFINILGTVFFFLSVCLDVLFL